MNAPAIATANTGSTQTGTNGLVRQGTDAWADVAPYLFDADRLSRTAQEVDFVVSMLGLAPGAAVCDLGCGIGRHSIDLARRGFAATAVDLTPALLDRGRVAATAESVIVEWIEADMREFARPRAFDAIVNLSTSFGWFDDPADDARALSNMRTSLRDGGQLVIELQSKEVIARTWQPPQWSQRDGVLVMTERRVLRDWTWVEHRFVVERAGRREEFALAHRLYSAAELGMMLAGAGFVEARAFGDFDGRPYDEHADRLIVIAR